MPLLLCPNDNAAMQTVQRSGVEFDICPACRGVWLDRGELEKLLAAAREDSPPEHSGNSRAARAAFAPMARRDRDDRRDGDDDDSRFHQKKRRSSIFDIFD